MANPLTGKRILLGITGSIAAYKGADLASKLTQAGAVLDVILTRSAEKFITPLTFQSLTGRKCYTDDDLWGGEGHVTHIGLGRAAEMVVIAPASATTLARLANGFGDTLLSLAVLASHSPLILAPAMDVGMYMHPATQANVETLRSRGAHFIGPAEGRMASGLVGFGRFVEPADILRELRFLASSGGPLNGKKLVVTAGGSQEAIDPVRLITNRSSGKQGYAVAQAALDAGAKVTLISAPTSLTPPFGAEVIPVKSAAEMQQAVIHACQDADVLIMAAAVADFRPANPSAQKIKKTGDPLTIQLEPTQDILAEIAQRRERLPKLQKVIGFAAESQDLLANARKKLEAKKLDLIVANDISASDAGFEVDTNRVTFIMGDGTMNSRPLSTKEEVAAQIINQVIDWLS